MFHLNYFFYFKKSERHTDPHSSRSKEEPAFCRTPFLNLLVSKGIYSVHVGCTHGGVPEAEYDNMNLFQHHILLKED